MRNCGLLERRVEQSLALIDLLAHFLEPVSQRFLCALFAVVFLGAENRVHQSRLASLEPVELPCLPMLLFDLL